MAGLQFLTASYRNDLVPFEDLHRSILRYGPEDAMHLVVVPDCDVPLFARFGGERTLVRPVSAYLPRPLLSVTGVTQWFRGVPGLSSLARIDAINPFRPYPPVRGWIRQQITKLAAAAASDAEAVVIVDSDVSLVRPVASDTFVRDGVVRFYRLPEGITPDMRRHRRWVEIAAGLLDLPAAPLGLVEFGLLIGTPGLAALAVATSALVAGLRGASALAGLVMLPIAVPLLIFGVGSLADGPAALKLLAAVSLILVAGAPFVAGAAIRAGNN